MQALQAGDFPMKSSRWPSVFYEKDVYDPDDKTIGLFQNHTVVRASRTLIFGAIMTYATYVVLQAFISRTGDSFKRFHQLSSSKAIEEPCMGFGIC